MREIPDSTWMTDKACGGLGDIMFPPLDLDNQDLIEAYQRAVAVCDTCKVKAECLQWALNAPKAIEFGVVAGLTPGQLKEARKPRLAYRVGNRVPKCGTERAYSVHLQLGEDCARCKLAHCRKNQQLYAS